MLKSTSSNEHDSNIDILQLSLLLIRACLCQIDRALSINTYQANRPMLYFHRSLILGHLGSFSKAIEEVSEAIKLDPENSKLYRLRSIFWRLDGQYMSASKDCKRENDIQSMKLGHKKMRRVMRQAFQAISLTTNFEKGAHATQVSLILSIVPISNVLAMD